MKRILTFLSTALVLVATLIGCHKDELRSIHKSIENDREIVIPTMAAQVEVIDASVKNVQAMNEELKGYVIDLEATLLAFQPIMDNIKQDLADFTQKSEKDLSESREKYLGIIDEMESSLTEELEKAGAIAEALAKHQEGLDPKIDSIKTYIDTTFAKKDWVEATFASLDVQEELYHEIVSIKANIENLTTTTAALYDNMCKLVDDLTKDYGDDFDADLKAAMDKLTGEYTDAVKKMKEDLLSGSEKTLTEAIATLEEKLKGIIEKTLTEEYLTITAAEAKIDAFYKIVGRKKDDPKEKSIQEELDALNTQVKGMKEALDPAFKEFLSKAISDYEGKITEYLEKEFKTVKESIGVTQSSLDGIQSDMKNLSASILKLDQSMTSLQKDLANLEKALTALDETFAAFFGKDYKSNNLSAIIGKISEEIEKCKKAIEENSTNYEKLNQKINGTGGLSKQIADLMHISTDLKALQTSISALEAFYEGESIATFEEDIKDAIDKCTTPEKVAALKKTIDELVENVTNFEEEYSKATATLTKIKTFLGITDETEGTLSDQINEMDKQLKKILEDLVKDSSDLEKLIARVTEVEKTAAKLDGLLKLMEEIDKKLETIYPLFNFAGTEFEGQTLKEIWDELQKQIEELEKWEVFGAEDDTPLRDQIDKINEFLYGKEGTADNPKEGSLLYRITDLEKQITAYSLANSFATIVYVPTRLDQAAALVESSKECTFKFLVKPSSVAEKLAEYLRDEKANEMFSMKWFSGSNTSHSFQSQTASYDTTEGTISVTVTGNNELINAADSDYGAFAALYVDVPLTDKVTLSFTSEFIQIIKVTTNIAL